MKRLIAVFPAMLILASCASLSKSECQSGEWQATGYEDGSHGLTSSRFNAHVKACAKHGIAADNALYTAGYQDGLEVYCQPEVGIELGLSTKHYRGVCPANLETGFLFAYLEGLDIVLHGLNQNYAEVKDGLITARYRRLRLESPDDIKRIDHHINTLQNKLRNINIKQGDLRATIARWSTRI